MSEVKIVVLAADVDPLHREGKASLYFQEVWIQLPGRPFPEAVRIMHRAPADAVPVGKYTAMAESFLAIRDGRIGTVFGLPKLTAEAGK